MLNTCSIGRRWKPREGWSRPVLTGERGTLFPTRLLGRVSSCGGFFRWMARNAVSCGHDDDTGEAFGCSRPLSGSRTATIGIGRVAGSVCRPIPWWVGRYIGFAVVMAQVRRPVPFRTRKLRPGTAMVLHPTGCGRVARRRIQLTDLPVEPHRGSRKVLFYSRARVSSSIRWRKTDAGRTAGGMIPPSAGGFCSAGRPVGGRIPPVTGSPGTLGDPRNFGGASCPYPMVE